MRIVFFLVLVCEGGYQLDAECNLLCFHCNPKITSSV